jgi:predicted nucleotidyltransferase component of viral defense system
MRTMNLREIVAEKIRATATRVRCRDVYDLYLMLENKDIEVDKVVELARQREVRGPIGPEQIRVSGEQAHQQADDDQRSIHCSRRIGHEAISAMVSQLQFEPISPE